MSTATIRPNSDASVGSYWVGNPSASLFENVDESSLNNADWNIHGYQGTYTDCIFGHASGAVPAGSTINSVTVHGIVTKADTGSGIKAAVRVGSTTYNGDEYLAARSQESVSYTWTTNPATSAAWTVNEIDSMGFGHSAKGGGFTGRTVIIFQAWVVVDYTEASTFTPRVCIL